MSYSVNNGAGYQLDAQRQKYLLRKVNQLAQARLAALLGEVFDTSSEALIKETEGVEVAAQRRYFDALCRLYGKRESLASGFAEHFATHYYAAVNRSLAAQPADAPPWAMAALSEHAVFEALLAGLEREACEPQQRLHQQFEIILGTSIPVAEYPLSYQPLLQALWALFAELDAPAEVNQLYAQFLAQRFEDEIVPILQEIISYLDHELAECMASGNDAVAQLIHHLQQNLADNESKIVEGRIVIAMAKVDVVVAEQVKGMALLEPVASLLMGPWKTLMASILIEEGEQSLRWQVCLQVTEELIKSIQPIDSPMQRQALIKSIPRLVQLLRINLQEITWLQLDSQRIFAQLEQLHLSKLSAAKI